MSSQRSARAGEVASATVNSSEAASRIVRQNGCREIIIECPLFAIEASAERERQSAIASSHWAGSWKDESLPFAGKMLRTRS
jgi:hypothetical protein